RNRFGKVLDFTLDQTCCEADVFRVVGRRIGAPRRTEVVDGLVHRALGLAEIAPSLQPTGAREGDLGAEEPQRRRRSRGLLLYHLLDIAPLNGCFVEAPGRRERGG